MLKHIQSILNEEKFECSLIKATDEFPHDHLLVFLGIDNQNRERILEITAQEQVLNPEIKAGSKSYYRIQFKYNFPFAISDLAVGELGSLLLFLNQQIDFPGFEMNELNNKASFRYVWMVKGNGVDKILIVSFLGIIRLLLELFSSPIEKVAEGSSTFNQLLEEIVKLAQK